MAPAQKLPRKHLGTIADAISDLKCTAHRLGLVMEELERGRQPSPAVLTALQAVRAQSYQVALRLSEVEVAGSCDECPTAPASVRSQMVCQMLQRELIRLAEVAQKGIRDR